MTARAGLIVLAGGGALAGCSDVQSALAPAGTEAQEIGILFWVATAILTAIFLLVVVATILAFIGSPRWRAPLAESRAVVAGGIVLPVVILTGLLAYGLVVLEAGAARSMGATGPGVTITGKQWWWRVVYRDADGREVVSANELRLPVGEPVVLHLETTDVIHSFWAPQIGGKLDMIPGRSNSLTVTATQAGASRAQCAEYCGGAHARMSMFVVALDPEDYRRWLAAEASPAAEPTTELAARGGDLFLQYGCGACHAVRGTEAQGAIGPDLTHVGNRRSLAAGALANNTDAFALWIADHQDIKPGNKMPRYDVLSADEIAAMAAYLDALE